MTQRKEKAIEVNMLWRSVADIVLKLMCVLVVTFIVDKSSIATKNNRSKQTAQKTTKKKNTLLLHHLLHFFGKAAFSLEPDHESMSFGHCSLHAET